MKVTLKNVRLAFPALWEPEAIGDGEPAYGARLILPPDHPDVAMLRKAIDDVAKAKWPGVNNKGDPKWKAILEIARKDENVCLSEKDYCNKEGDVYDGFEGNFNVATRSQVQPLIIDRDRTELTKRDGRPYSGSFIVAKVELWAQDNSYGRGIRAQLTGVQFYKDGDAFAGGTKASADDFDDLSDMGEEQFETELA